MAEVEIKRRHTGDVLYVHEATDERVALGIATRDALEAACKARADLRDADLRGAYLDGAKLIGGRPVLFICPIGSRSDYLQASITDVGVMIRAGCFSGTRNEFAARARSEHGDTAHGREYAAALAMIDAHASLWTPPDEPVEVPA